MLTTNIDVRIRPKTLNNLYNSSVYEDIKELISTDNLNHTILLSGAPGTGKTTTGRAIASYIFSRDPELEFDLENEPCYIEANSTKYSGKDDAKILIDSVLEPPLARDYIVLLIDEAQGLTTQAQSVLLKSIEEPPEHLYIILCTTEPEKIRKDIRDRCKKFTFSQPTKSMVSNYIQNYAKPNLLDTFDSATITKCKEHINNLNEAMILQLVDAMDSNSYREAIRVTHHYLITGNILLTQSEEAEANIAELHEVLIFPAKLTWRAKLKNAINTIDDYETFRKYLVNYLSTILRNRLLDIDFKKFECYTYAINTLKEDLSYSCQKADFINRLIDISLHSIKLLD